MAVVTISGDTRDSTVRNDNRPWYVQAHGYQSDGSGGVVTPRRSRALYPKAGVLSFEVESGLALTVANPDGDVYLVTVPGVDTDLWELIEAGVAFPPDTSQDRLDAAVGQYVESNRQQFRTRAVPVDPEDPDSLYQWVDANGDAVGEPVGLADIVSVGWASIDGKPAAMGVGATPAAAREAIGALSLEDMSATGKLLARVRDTARARAVLGNEFDLVSFLDEDEGYPDDGVLDASPLIQRAIDAINDIIWADTTDRVFTLNLGPGQFRLNTSLDLIGDKAYAKRLKIRGESRWRTILLPHGTASGFYSAGNGVTTSTPLDFFWYDDCHFEDFTIDCRNQTTPEPGSFQKAFVGGGWKDCTFSRVNAVGSTGSTFGMDHPVRMMMTDCHVIGSGRGYTLDVAKSDLWPEPFAEARSGFGIGFGWYDDESITFVGCSATGCLRGGFFFERQDGRGLTRRDQGAILLIGCESSGNGIGVIDAGCVGVVAVNCKLTDNVGAGWYSGRNGNSVQGGIFGRIAHCTIERNGFGVYFGDVNSSPTPVATPEKAAGGYVVEYNRISDNVGPGIGAKTVEFEAGGLAIRGNQFVRNGGPGVDFRGCTQPVRDLTLCDNDFDGNAKIGLALLVPMNAPVIVGNRFTNSDGTARQVDAIHLHPAEQTTLPRIQGNTWRRHSRGLVNTGRCAATYISDNREVAAGSDPDSAGLHQSWLAGASTTADTLGTGWTQVTVGTAMQWQKDASGARPSAAASAGILGLQTRDLGRNDLYVSAGINSGSGSSPLRGVALAVTGTTAIIAGVDHSTAALGAPAYYALWKLISSVPTLLHTTAVPYSERHRVSLAREKDSTVTTMCIDDVVVHTRDIPDVAVSNVAGVVGVSDAGVSGRRIGSFRAIAIGDGVELEEPEMITVRNMATNPGFEVSGGLIVTDGVGGAHSTTRPSDSGAAHSGSYSYLVTWTTATTDPSGAAGRYTTVEAPVAGKTYTGSIWIKSSRARRYRAGMRTIRADSSYGQTYSDYVDVSADVWTRLSVTTSAIASDVISMNVFVEAASTANSGTNFQIGDTVRFDDAMVTEGAVLYDFFSGDINGGAWVGTANASASTKTIPV